MSTPFSDPNKIPLNAGTTTVKFDFKGLLAATIKTVLDVPKPTQSLGGGTITEWVKAVKIEPNIELEAFQLITESLVKACLEQLRDRIDALNQDGLHPFIYLVRDCNFLQGRIEKQLKVSDYTLDLNQLKHPRSFPLLADFKPYYRDWITENFPISDAHASALAAVFPDYFAYYLHLELSEHGSRYPKLIAAYQDPMRELLNVTLARQRYRIDMKARYHMPAMGQDRIALSDIYIEPRFTVYHRILADQSESERHEPKLNRKEQFVECNYPNSLHHYLLNYFLQQKRSKALDHPVEQSRMLILMGQPGHGKSSFCYRSMHDLLEDPNFAGNVFFVRLQEAGKDILRAPLSEIADTPSIAKYHMEFREIVDRDRKVPCVIFLDGLDELFITRSLSDTDVIEFLNNCKRFLERNEHLYFVITSRFNYVETGKLYNEDALILALDTLTTAQQVKMVEKYNNRMQPEEKSSFTKKQLERVNNNSTYEHIKELIELPILLQMILISKIDIEEANSRAKIYDELFTTILNRKWENYQRLKKQRDKGKFKAKHLREYISFLAFKTFQLNKGYLNKGDIIEFHETKNFIKKRLIVEHKKDELIDVLKDVLTSFYLRETTKDKQNYEEDNFDYAIEFLHKSLYEYLACEYIWKETKTFFTAKDDEGEYQSYDISQVQQKIQELYANITMTKETAQYMQEIVRREFSEDIGLASQMNSYFQDLLKFGFIFEYRVPKTNSKPFITPENQVLNTFYLYWLILGSFRISQDDPYPYLKMDGKDILQDQLYLTVKMDLWKTYLVELENQLNHRLTRKVQQQNINEKLGLVKQMIDADTSLQIHADLLPWVRHYLYRQSGAKLKPVWEAGQTPAHHDFGRFLRLIAANRFFMGIDLSFVNLCGIDLIGIYAVNIKLEGCDLSNADLSNADLSYADLSYADLRHADLSNAYLSYAYLSYAYLRNADLSYADLSYVDLRHADLSYADLRHADLSNAYLRNAYLRHADLSNAYLRHADLSNADLSYAYLSYAYLRNADLSYADLSYAYLSYADLSNAYLRNADLRNADLRNADLSNADLRNADLSNAYLRNADLRNADLRNADLRNADLRDIELENARVDTKDWFDRLSKWQVQGDSEIVNTYRISDEKRTFVNKYGVSYEAYYLSKKT